MDNSIYQKVLSKVKQGIAISESIKMNGLNSWNFYKQIDKEQKSELLLYKTMNTKKSKYGGSKVDLFLDDNFKNTDYENEL